MNTSIPVFDLQKPMPNDVAQNFPSKIGPVYYAPIPGEAVFVDSGTVHKKHGKYVVWYDRFGSTFVTCMHEDEFAAFYAAEIIVPKEEPADKLTFGFDTALNMLREGKKLCRQGWNGKNMYIYLAVGSKFQVSRPPISKFVPEGTWVEYRPHIDMRCADGSFVPWVASQSDILAYDWSIVL